MLSEKLSSGIEAVKHVAELTDTVLLGFSGKDSICAWLRMRPHFRRIIPIYHYWVPDLEFAERGLRYYEEYFQTRIIRLPHPALMDAINRGDFQPPHRFLIAEWWDWASADFREQADWVAEDLGIAKEDAWLAVGLRSADSVRRLMFFQRYGTVLESQRKFYPIAELKKPDLVQMLEDAKIKLPPEYAIMPRSFDGLTIDYLRPIREHWPEDWQRILEWFPNIDAEFERERIYRESKG